LGWLVEACGARRADRRGGFQVLEGGPSRWSSKSDERIWETELYRRKGELLLNAERGMQNDERNAKNTERNPAPYSAFIVQHSSFLKRPKACFLKAIDIARRQHAKSFELRAVDGSEPAVAQAEQGQSKARQMLAEVYSWFTEGFDTAGLARG